MGRGGYAGMDESNHGRFPEIFVSVYSRDPKDSQFVGGQGLPKRRANKSDLSRFIGTRDCKHTVIEEVYGRLLGVHGIKVVAITEFLKNYASRNMKLDTLVIDGEVKGFVFDEVTRLLKPMGLELPKNTDAIPKGDRHYNLVNIADAVANDLHRKYSKHKGIDPNTVKRLLTPQMERYGELITRLQKKKAGK